MLWVYEKLTVELHKSPFKDYTVELFVDFKGVMTRWRNTAEYVGSTSGVCHWNKLSALEGGSGSQWEGVPLDFKDFWRAIVLDGGTTGEGTWEKEGEATKNSFLYQEFMSE